MNELITLIAELGGGGGLLVFLVWKYAIPGFKKLYGELTKLREENAELKARISAIEVDLKHTKQQLEYFKSKYTEKVVLKSHGKIRK